jgi:hypothetical protein
MKNSFSLVVALLVLHAHSVAFAQSWYGSARLHPTLDISMPTLESSLHTPLPEQYIWSRQTGDVGGSTFLYFQKSFSLRNVPGVATLYAAGPNLMKVYVNGRLLAKAMSSLLKSVS